MSEPNISAESGGKLSRDPDEMVSDEKPRPEPKRIVACERNSQRLSSFTVDTSVCASITYPICSRYGP
jgi:hypothetical protein